MTPDGFRWRAAMNRTRRTFVLVVLGGLTGVPQFAGCRVAPAGIAPSATRAERVGAHTAWRRLAFTEFDQAFYFKPDESPSAEDALTLAPLVVQQVEDGAAAYAPRFGRVAYDSASSEVIVDTMDPIVYVEGGAINMRGIEYTQSTYIWCYGATPAGAKDPLQPDADGEKRARPSLKKVDHCVSVRMTRGRDGFPVVWEVFDSNADVRRLFVARALEEAAQASFGAPLPGRMHAVERDLRESPRVVVVVRILDDGPMPMGPYVYLDATARTITTVLCRCSPSQCAHFVDEHRYQLEPWESLDERLRRTGPESVDLTTVLRWPTGW